VLQFVVTVLDARSEEKKKATTAISVSAPKTPKDALEAAATEFFISDVPPAHTLFFNKFPVVQNAVVLTTKVFEPQAAPLSASDMRALWAL
jgi:ATP adenylyltransferase/5',5'''-P-1,P-4-tetraphosphate phosphorylase II